MSRASLERLPERISGGLASIDSVREQLGSLETSYERTQAALDGASERLAGLTSELAGAARTMQTFVSEFASTGEPLPQALEDAAEQLRSAAAGIQEMAARSAGMPVVGPAEVRSTTVSDLPERRHWWQRSSGNGGS